MSAPRVLFVTGEYPPLPGGVGDYTARLRAALAPLGIVSHVLTRSGAAGEHVVTIDRWDWRAPGVVDRWACERGVDIVHLQYQAGAFAMHPAINLLPWLQRRSGRPVVTTFHDLRPPYLLPKAGRLRRLVLVRMARAARVVVATNPADERLLTRAGVAVTRILIGSNLPPPVAPSAVDDGSVAFFGFLSRSKGIEDLVAALRGIPPDTRPQLTLAGAPGEPSANNDIVAAADIERLAAANGVALVFTGALSPQAASDALACAGVIVLPYREGASLRNGSLLAALQVGRPVVTTASGYASDIEPLAALPQLHLVPAGDIDALRRAIVTALHTSTGALPLPDVFGWESIAERHRDLYASIVTRHSP